MKKTYLALLSIAIVGLLAVAAVSAYRGNYEEQGPNFDASVHEEMQEAIENGDYEDWISLREENKLPMKGRIFSIITEENFEQFKEMHLAQIQGDTATASQIRAELGLGLGNAAGDKAMSPRKGQGNMAGRGTGQQAQMQDYVDADGDGNCDNYKLSLSKRNR
jgi:hypothetical protein